WQKLETDFLSDIIYLRYATNSPTIDPETGNVFVQGGQGVLSCLTADGKMVWQHSLMEEYGRMTFPNSRTATPVIDREPVIPRRRGGREGRHQCGRDHLQGHAAHLARERECGHFRSGPDGGVSNSEGRRSTEGGHPYDEPAATRDAALFAGGAREMAQPARQP